MCFALCACAMMLLTSASAQVKGAIFTTVVDGSEVNYNIYGAKEDVYLDGGPGVGAPATAAGLPDGIYVFQVTDPSGKTLLSTDIASCRRFTISGGIITTANPGCHNFGQDKDHGATTIQLMPYNDTPNHGGEYKVWVMNQDYYPQNCMNTVDCGRSHGFINRYSKTDNYKVGGNAREIDSRFFYDVNKNGYKDGDEVWVDGLGITWTDTLGASNNKWSYLNTALDINHEAHVEDVENGTHTITVANQAGCTVGNVFVNGTATKTKGPQTVSINIKSNFQGTVFVDTACVVQ
jgi:hypothetical protein